MKSVYIISLLSTLENYCNYLHSDDGRSIYILPVLSILYNKVNIVLFENKDDKILYSNRFIINPVNMDLSIKVYVLYVQLFIGILKNIVC